MHILGLTGSIGMGKSTVAGMLRRLRVPVYCADLAVHALMAPGGAAVARVGAAFPSAARKKENGRAFIDRKALGAEVFNDAKKMQALEAILHPLVRGEEKKFLQACRRQRQRLVVLDIPLLFETRMQDVRRCYFEKVLVVTAPAFLQRQRVLARAGMTAQRLDAILRKQMPDARKRKLADILLQTGLGRAAALRQLQKIIARERP